MRVEFYDGDKLIGQSQLKAADPPMGIASGPFEPTNNYRRDLHANTIDDDYVGDKTKALRLAGPGLDPTVADVLAIEDYQVTLQERVVHIRVEASRYEELFSNDPGYRAYYKLDLPEDERQAEDRTVKAKLQARDIRAWLWLLAILGALALLLIWIV